MIIMKNSKIVKHKIKEFIYNNLIWNWDFEMFYLDRYKENPNFEDLEKAVRKSRNIEEDIEEIINTGFLYEFYFNGEYYHDHSFKRLLTLILYCLEEDPKGSFDFTEFEHEYSEQQFNVIFNFISKVRELF